MKWTDIKGTVVDDAAPYTAPNGTTYPPNFPKGEIPGLSQYAPSQSEIDAQFLATRSMALLQIDADTDSVYGAVLGNRAEEYTLAATEAQAYKAANYTGTVPGSVQSWATAKSWTATQAADDILATAAQWTAAQAAIRAARLARKEQVRNSANAAGVTAALTAWASFLAVVRGQLGIA